ncbi:hypothetical protein PAXINDRAFT_163929 [Paxillus involutus ATCC 200175]|uniref:CxC2-like cysteine cluster KDZ transposase-associated domain-containing protein n=1 Tax=Paxillus involutus ATCC 200175 TaxID=664439 RepID=A0A0C9STV8_PAXIN|nr:hypothetical protein PAXINDRAFT_163929 [Paxillus involutus ATCC 200175]
MLRLEGRGNFADSCALCDMEAPLYRCEDCTRMAMHCASCVVLSHAQNLLHTIKKWNSQFFEQVSLKDLGLRVQLGHKPGEACGNPTCAFNDQFVVLDTNGIHTISLYFCGCKRASSHVQQLLRFSWFPATSTRPRTAAMFRLLKQYHLVSLESKLSAYEFYNALSRLTNNTGLLDVKNRYKAFLRMSREWHHLKMVKCAGRSTEAYIFYTACPQPDINLPDDFRQAPLQQCWLYGLFVAVDANFRLKRKKVSKDAVDPSLSKGWAYFVEESDYKAFLNRHIDVVQEKSTCSSHNAVNMADTKSNKGLSATGVGTVDCARHNMKLPSGVGDLQKGERYMNMDYLFFSTLRHNSVDVLNVSYDIACQWNKHLWARMSNFPLSMQLTLINKNIRFFVPKFHLPAHIDQCQTTFSFNFLPGVGRTDGEAPERGWANINPTAASTKEMGPGARCDTLDDHFGHWNWKKISLLGETMLEKLKDAIPKRADHAVALEELTAGLVEDHSDDLERWKKQVEDWERDSSKQNPYERAGETIMLAAVRLQLAKEDAQQVHDGSCVTLHEDCSASVLISAGLELEQLQHRLKSDKAGVGAHSTDTQEAKLVEQSNTLQRRIDSWVKLQQLFVPVLASLRTRNTQNSNNSPETFNLMLPSRMGRSMHYGEKFQRIEWRLRDAQAHDSLHSLHSNLRAQSYVLKYKDRNLRGQGANTRARNTLKGIDARIDAAANRYRNAHEALVILGPLLKEVGWQATLCPLNRQHIRAMSDLLDDETEGTKKLSWIWTVRGSTDAYVNGEGSLDDMRIEWCKARARAMRWAEEVMLLVEEMRRILAFFEWDAKHWDLRGKDFNSQDGDQEGFRAYARRQAALRRALAERNRAAWKDAIYDMDLLETTQHSGAESEGEEDGDDTSSH